VPQPAAKEENKAEKHAPAKESYAKQAQPHQAAKKVLAEKNMSADAVKELVEMERITKRRRCNANLLWVLQLAVRVVKGFRSINYLCWRKKSCGALSVLLKMKPAMLTTFNEVICRLYLN